MMKMSEEISALAAALSKAQSSIEDATKGTENDYFKSKYADLSAVRDTIRKPLAENELSIAQFPTTAPNGVSVETVLMHSSGQYMSASVWVPISKMDAHGIGSGITYARRYGLMSLLCIASEDDDGNAAVDSIKKAQENEKNKQDAEDLFLDGMSEAVGGMSALSEWFREIGDENRSKLSTKQKADLKKTAVSADATMKEG